MYKLHHSPFNPTFVFVSLHLLALRLLLSSSPLQFLLDFLLPSVISPPIVLLTRFLRQACLLKRGGGLKLEHEEGID